jgi:protein-disulfide isomerase
MSVLFSLMITCPAYADINLELITAAKKGDIAKVKKCLSEGADVSAKDEKYGRSALMWAVMSGDKNTAKLLIKNGADVNAKDKNGQTAITWTALYQSYDLFDLLKNAGARNLSRIKTTSDVQIKKDTPKKSRDEKVVKSNNYARANFDISKAMSQGPEDAPITMIEVIDYQCPYCKKIQPTIEALLDQYSGKIRLVIMNNPLSYHKNALSAALAARAAREQGMFWEMHKLLLLNSNRLYGANLIRIAENLDLNIDAFNADRKDETIRDEILKEQAHVVRNGATGTPAFFINGRKVSSSNFQKVIDEELEINEHKG